MPSFLEMKIQEAYICKTSSSLIVNAGIDMGAQQFSACKCYLCAYTEISKAAMQKSCQFTFKSANVVTNVVETTFEILSCENSTEMYLE